MLTVRLSDEEEKVLNEYCLRYGISKSLVVKEAIELYLTQQKKNSNPYEAGVDLLGTASSGTKTKSRAYKKRLKEKLHEKHSH